MMLPCERRRLLELIMQNYNKPKNKGLIERIDDLFEIIRERVFQTSILPSNCVGKIRIDPEIEELAERQTRSTYDFEIKGYALFDWFMHNARYEEGNCNYKDSTRTLNDRTGNCAEFSFLYIAMARSIGIESNFVDVLIDSNGEDLRK
ncbi:transglutaminase domain-containing protein, partial [Candidatus Woesearchaeota archaeon]|nr:transglutaminase domain-containing protein [Candidatus Woesearchaeota archaeon]